MMIRRWTGPLLAVVVLAGGFTGCDYINPTTQNPNAVPSATVDQLFTSIQVASFFDNEGDESRMSAIWTQQMDGTDRQYATYATYNITEGNEPGEWTRFYTGGGLVDIKSAEATADSTGRYLYEGILQVYEALDMELAATTYGDIPYSQALQPEAPLDKQLTVYQELESLLDNALTNLGKGGLGPGAADLNFGGDQASWEAVAHSLKARIDLLWAGAGGANAAQHYSDALAEAQKGIDNPSGNWETSHTGTKTENNVWFQFDQDRSGYISAGAFLVDLLKNRTDPRLPIYFTEAQAGGYVGSPVGSPAGDPAAGASQLNVPGGASFAMPIISCSETQFIIAEVESHNGNDAAARSAAKAGLTCQEDYWNAISDAVTAAGGPIDLTAYKSALDGLTGTALFNQIMTEKYIALFLNHEVWRDWLRTCQPAIPVYVTTANGGKLPDRVYYPIAERNNNPNIDNPGTGNNTSPTADDPHDSCTK